MAENPDTDIYDGERVNWQSKPMVTASRGRASLGRYGAPEEYGYRVGLTESGIIILVPLQNSGSDFDG